MIPNVAKGYEEFYQRFLNGKLIYTDPQSKQQIEMPIAKIADPNTLEGTFDLSMCGDTGQHLSISTGYKKTKNSENASKVEIWLAPWFLAKNVTQFQAIMGAWNEQSAPLGIFWTWGGYDVANNNFDYLTNKSVDDIMSKNLYENWSAWYGSAEPSSRCWRTSRHAIISCFNVKLELNY